VAVSLSPSGGPAMRALSSRITRARSVVLLLDYDGTLAPLRRRPDRPRLSRHMQKTLVRLNNRSGVHLGFVSGRSMRDLRSRIAMTGVAYAANHGFELRAEGKRWIHPYAGQMRADLSRIGRNLVGRLKTIPGASIEDKRYTLSIHFRRVSPSRVGEVLGAVGESVKPFGRRIRLTGGKKVVEVRPAVMWGKGHAVRMLLHRHFRRPAPLVVYCGDDATDEDVFRMLPRSAVTIHVGSSTTTHARFAVRKISEVLKFLRVVDQLRRSVDAGRNAHGGRR
jgi:trehalose-phosphatase